MSWQTIDWAMKLRVGLDHLVFRVVLALAECSDEKGEGAHPSVDWLEWRCESPKRVVRRALRKAETMGLIDTDVSVGRGLTSEYRLNLTGAFPKADKAAWAAEKERRAARKGDLKSSFPAPKRGLEVPKRGLEVPKRGPEVPPYFSYTKEETTPSGRGEPREGQEDRIEQGPIVRSVPPLAMPEKIAAAVAGNGSVVVEAAAPPTGLSCEVAAAQATPNHMPATKLASRTNLTREATPRRTYSEGIEAEAERQITILNAMIEAEEAEQDQPPPLQRRKLTAAEETAQQIEATENNIAFVREVTPDATDLIAHLEAQLAELRATPVPVEATLLRLQQSQVRALTGTVTGEATPAEATLTVQQKSDGIAATAEVIQFPAAKPAQSDLLADTPAQQQASISKPPTWSEGLAILVRLGVAEPTARPKLGQLRALAGDDDKLLMTVLREADQKQPADPFPWLRKALAQKAKQKAAPAKAAEGDAYGVDAWCERTGAEPIPAEKQPPWYTVNGYVGPARWLHNGKLIDRIARNVAEKAGFDRTQAIDFALLAKWLFTDRIEVKVIYEATEGMGQWLRGKGEKPRTLHIFDKAVRRAAGKE